MTEKQAEPTFWIERLEVEGGFLDGLDLQFAQGLNTIIGARGTGKTSIIELIRFCVDAPAMTDLTAARAADHARAVLADGRAILTVVTDGERTRIARSAYDDDPEYGASLVAKPLVFAQNEIEVVAADEGGLRRLLDAFAPGAGVPREAERAILAEITGVTAALRMVVQELDVLTEQARDLAPVQNALAVAEAEQKQILAAADATKPDQERAEALNLQLSALRVQSQALERVRVAALAWAADIGSVRAMRPSLEMIWPQAAASTQDPFRAVEQALDQAEGDLGSAADVLERITIELGRLLQQTRMQEVQAADEARELRARLEAAAGGAGAAARRVAELRQQAAEAASIQERIAATGARLQRMQHERVVLLDDLDDLRAQRFQARSSAAQQLTARLSPEVDVRVNRLGAFDGYTAAIARGLRGSQIHYNSIAPLLAKSMSPRELVECVESGRSEELARLVGIDNDRASRIVTYLRTRGAEEILAAELEDVVQLCLLDGGAYKSTQHLSTGQRCTVVLAVLLQHEDRVIVIDQPEDHLDNAFIARTLVPSIVGRGTTAQLIVSTHNPNIPVLGEAAKVIVLESDGASGHVESAEPLDAPASVRSITDLMEGGLEALQRRARFYESAFPPAV